MKRGEKVKRKQPKTQTAFAKKRKIPTGKISKSDVDKIAKTYKKYRKAAPMAKKVAKKVVGKLGIAGKAAVGASMLYHYSKKTGCKPGMSKVTKNGKSYCTPSKGSKKGRDY